ncbi:unnamed protein product [Spirodela intermedia]|uniref:Uncharacterized protein n=1 Tax=Spirodela intermedia TaxID=51605 RepID=A0A7I8LAI1_SPIIN|nr:unnamed protein product [Spirodela intermedia]
MMGTRIEDGGEKKTNRLKPKNLIPVGENPALQFFSLPPPLPLFPPPLHKTFHRTNFLTTESVEGPALSLQGVHNVHGGDGLPASVLRVGDSVADDVLEEDLENSPRLLVDQPADALNSSPPRQPPDRRLRNALDVVPQHLAVALRATLPQALASLPPARHCISETLTLESRPLPTTTSSWTRNQGDGKEVTSREGGGKAAFMVLPIGQPMPTTDPRIVPRYIPCR